MYCVLALRGCSDSCNVRSPHWTRVHQFLSFLQQSSNSFALLSFGSSPLLNFGARFLELAALAIVGSAPLGFVILQNTKYNSCIGSIWSQAAYMFIALEGSQMWGQEFTITWCLRPDLSLRWKVRLLTATAYFSINCPKEDGQFYLSAPG